MSWFSFESITDLSNKIQESLPIDADLKKSLVSGISKIALMSDELVNIRQTIDQEEKRRERVKYSLADLLPFETRDESREILVEDCRERILALSLHESSFTFPFEPLEGVRIFPADLDEHGNEVPQDTTLYENQKKEALDRLEKISPLPKLLEDFDIDCHVGLIQRMMNVDSNLVEMHSKLSGAGQKELLFWKNYFVNCAYVRFDLGLSVEEIWDRNVDIESITQAGPEESVISEDRNNIVEQPFPAATKQPSDTGITNKLSTSETSDSSSSFVKDGFDDNDLDSLEAEIAKELNE